MVDGRRRLASLPGVHRGGFESRAVELVFAVGRAAFWLYWILAAFSMKRGRIAWSRELRLPHRAVPGPYPQYKRATKMLVPFVF